ncbi:asparagine synthase (glutamine-hydrolyzing) [Algoriphagus zhangzhouensis]|uniref:asparagine synthase (glutamine-hydrolyzing) n=1 Tax=Algoriphagus zhangzhouensis TaxID=1073327 RepID=A0A1M7ZAS9_9BACT|nr:asparagine synthase (glutamine-hydrolyzing) [Algoriphagus zhangzhouensis]TDY47014.1 asparagine synthase (glutamine-hydrolysing) [Algoriphagus zhangzhouensis]SHO62027.1 asparagine synthase (glutamine-hydrolysing) [Algoriphagus zhangzhouensis]
MCGIHLIWGKGANQESIEFLVNHSTHRGPDQKAFFSPWPSLWIGVNRLKILHPGPDADQPFFAPDGNSFLIWNGEVYNYKNLRNILEKMGIEFITQSDTEVLLHWLKIFGAKGLESVKGMFSLIFVDLASQNVLVARDKNGEKPLYYHQDPTTLMISSESKGLGKLLGSKLDEGQLDNYYFMRTALPGKTFYKGVKEWKAARFSLIRQHSAFRWDNIPEIKKEESLFNKERFKELLLQSIQRQFHADMPVGMLLSGGADSSLLYSLWYKETGISLPTFTIEHEAKYSKKYDDAQAVSKLENSIPLEKNPIQVSQKIFWENWGEYLLQLDLPVGDSASFLTWLIGKEAKKSVKVLISGAGADELWGGYNRHQAFLKYQENKGLFLPLKSFLGMLPLGRNWKKFLEGIEPDSKKTFLNFTALERIDHDIFSDYERIFDQKLSPYKQILDFDRRVFLVQDILKIQDNALMAHGLEGRSPYLDEDLLNFWHQIKDEEVLKGKKWIREILTDLDLEWVSQRKKLGFGLPLLEWFSEEGEFASRVYASLESFKNKYKSSLPKPALQLLENPRKHVKTHFLTLYNLFLLAEWLKLNKL